MIVYQSPYPSITHLIPEVTLPIFLLSPLGLPSDCPRPAVSHDADLDAALFHPQPHLDLSTHDDLPSDLKQIPPQARPEARSISLSAIRKQAEEFALGLKSRQWQKGDVLSVVSENQHDYTVAILGAHLLGIKTALHNPSYTARELQGQFELVQTKGVLASLKAWGKCKEVFTAEDIWVFDEPRNDKVTAESSTSSSLPISWFSLFPNKTSKDDRDQLWTMHIEEVTADDDAVYCFSSGTSGKPKTVRLSHGNLVANVIQATSEMRDRTHRPLLERWGDGEEGWYNDPAPQAPTLHVGPPEVNEPKSSSPKRGQSLLSKFARKLNLSGKKPTISDTTPIHSPITYDRSERHIDILPQFHCYGLVVAFVAMHTNTPRYVLPRFSLPLFLHLVTQHKITFAFIVPPILLALCRSPIVTHSSISLSSLTRLASGAASLPTKLRLEIYEKYGIKVTNGYGMSEMSPIISLQMVRDLDISSDSVGILSTSTEARVVDVMSGQDVTLGEIGELWLRGPQRMRGYLNNPSANESTFVNSDGDGQDWLRTGDVVSIDQRGYIKIHDRTKDVIKVHGFQVSPSELEEALIAHKHVHDVAVVGVKLGNGDDEEDVPWAFCVSPSKDVQQSNDDQEATKALLKDVNQHLAKYKHIRGGE